jgi:hypothetical protein
MNEEDWIYFYEAASEVERSFKISTAVARKRLRQACAEQLITSMKAPHDDGHQLPFEFWSPVAPGEWRQREVDYDGADKDGCETAVMIREADYRHWLNDATKNNAQKVTNRGSPKRRLADQAIKKLWPGGIPSNLLNKEIEKAVGDWLKQQGLAPISRETILRAAGRK